MTRITQVAAGLAALSLIAATAAFAGTPPNRLDRNLGAVLSTPRIHNLYWDANWSANQPTFTRPTINTFSGRFASSGYSGPLGQYGVIPPVFSSYILRTRDAARRGRRTRS